LPSIGVTLYESRTWASVITPPQRHSATARRHVAGTDRESKMPIGKEASLEAQVPPVESRAMSQPAALLDHLSSPALPVLRSPSTGAPQDPEANSTPEPAGNDQRGSIAVHPVWDESPMPRPSTTAPNWRKATIDAISIGVNLATGGGESPDGQVEQQGNH
jgi:hypothetical protein